ncbi:glycosyltransferase family 1 protein [Methylocystis sp. JR02]|uniref:glycosyltransferase family 4 protein n=1 Tax=Methylocystis sp. JR02 TaxID=3046284 RepID=UPI0024B8FB33|nr:glycosyltransferase family 1 protein [Methylocystis sp. JR02]MDJ0449877.1 glycosyltransferase family 1 protein [Methylocystis sp. JR02]
MSEESSKDKERIRLLEFQLDYLRAELLHLTHERYRLTYSVSGHVYRFLRPVEQRLADAGAAIAAYFRPQAEKAPARAETSLPITASTPTLPARRLLIDVTGTVKRDAGTGIQRVVKEVARACHSGASFDIPAFAVRSENGKLYTANAFTAALGGAETGDDVEVAIAPGDRFLMLSDSWNAFEELTRTTGGTTGAPEGARSVFERIRANGGEIVTCIFDLIPELYPHACHEVTVPRYRAWLRKALLESDAFLAISRTVAEELADYVAAKGLPHRPGLKIGWFQCGADLAAPPTATPREKIVAAVAGDAPAFLMVGTIEPRKGHRIALQAFDALWRSGVDLRLIVVGRRGWFEEAIAAGMGSHPEFGRRLFWFSDVDDGELSYLYRHARALLLPSYAEGFGLPIVEAAQHGRPAICSDIPVFREVGGDGAIYFRVNDPDALAEAMRAFLAGRLPADPARTLNVSWADAARRIVAVVAREDWLTRLP